MRPTSAALPGASRVAYGPAVMTHGEEFSPRPRFIGTSSLVAVVVVVLVATLMGPSTHGRTVIFASAAAYLVATTVAVAWAERARSRLPMSVVLAGQLVLGALLMTASDGAAMIGVMPTISMAVLYRSVRAGVVVTALFTAWLAAALGRSLGLGALDVARAAAGFLAAATFVIIFSRLAVGERLARAKAERLHEELGRAHDLLRDYAAQVEELATAKERNRIAREIHDSLGHYLTGVNVQLEAAQTVLAGNHAARALECIGRAQAATQGALSEVRRSVAALRAPLRDAVARLVDECRASGLETGLVITGAARALPPRVEFALYRAVQEALTNVRRHAKASRADVCLTFGEGGVSLVVADDGVGVDGPPRGEGFGLVGMRERIGLVGGRMDIRTGPHAGFAVEVWVPG